MFKITAQLDLSRVEALRRAVAADIEGTGNGPLRQAMREAGDIYLDVMQERFIQFSRGAGNWPPLSPVTIAARLRRGKLNPFKVLKRARAMSAMNTHMLFDTQTLYKTLTPGAGYNQHDIPGGVSVGYFGGAIHPATRGIRVADVARWQHDGTRRIPPRPILVVPSSVGITKIHQTLQNGLDRIVEQHNGN